jgi:hypothetical protein
MILLNIESVEGTGKTVSARNTRKYSANKIHLIFIITREVKKIAHLGPVFPLNKESSYPSHDNS